MSNVARIAVTPGEPAGIGPDLVVKLVRQVRDVELVAFADPDLVRERARILGEPVAIETVDDATAAPSRPGVLQVVPVKLAAAVRCGHLDPANAPYVLETLRGACDACLQGKFQALVTGPVHKGVINDAGIAFSGHTEFLAHQCGVSDVVMMLTAPGLRVALVTTHLPLSRVSGAITAERLERVLRIVQGDMRRRLGIREPRIFVCGLNPHAGEGGHLGREEVDIIEPALERLRADGLHLTGPLPADTLFIPKYLQHADVVVAMYHDQGLPVLKHVGFGGAVNVTLGLPIIRTSVDHGTALDLAGSGRAELGSLQAALDSALDMARHSAGAPPRSAVS
ncbi:MAG: 4-hydroxythreonine-4-phosphate dehydrogenase PdxA [Gammaproteobacteria bacterium]